MPTALITGITGQDGLYLAELLLAKGYDVHGVIRGQNNPSASSSSASLPDVTPPQRRPHRHVQPDPGAARQRARRGLQPRRGLLRRLLLGERVHHHRRHRQWACSPCSRRCACTPATTRRRCGSTRRRARRCSARCRRSRRHERTLLWPRSPYGVSKVYGHHMTINYRESYGMHASLGDPLQPRVPAPRRGVRDPQDQPGRGRDHAWGCRTSWCWATSTPRRDWGFAGDYVEAMWLMLQQPEADDYVIATGETHSIRELRGRWPSRTSASTTGSRYVRQDPRFMRPAEVDQLRRRREQGPRGARLEARGRLRGARRDDGRRRHRRPARRAG